MKVSEFERGDVVILKSGGPKMTVTDMERDRDGSLIVGSMWFDTTHNCHTAQFYAVMLEKVE